MNVATKLARFVAGLSIAASQLGSASAFAPTASGEHGMVTSAQHLASEVGVEILRKGGNAIDAAVAVGYALAVVYPAAGNLGGGGFMTIRFADGRTTFLDFREKAPLAATQTMFQDKQGKVVAGRSTEGWLAVGVPGTVAGYETALSRYGRLPHADVIAPAIALARDGFELGDGDILPFQAATDLLARDPAAARIFTHDGKPLQIGDRLVQPQLAASLETIARMGADSFRVGPLGEAIAAASLAGGGLLAKQDFATYRVRELTPITCSYRGYTITSAPPPSSGGVTLCEILNILEGYDLHALGFHSVAEVRVLVEAMRRAYHDRNTRLGDPDFVANPVARLIDKDYAAGLRVGIDPARATPSAALATPDPERPETTHFSVVDADGTAVALTTTLNGWFGTGIVAGETGILLNNEMDDFTAKPGVPNMFGLVQGESNAVAPGKTPLSSMSPTILSKDGRLVMVTGSPGGSRIITITLETIINVIDHGMTIQDAVDAPRLHHQYQPDSVDLEPGALTPEVRTTLEGLGYAFRDRPAWGHAESILIGDVQRSATGSSTSTRRFGVNDHRAPAGAAVGY